MTSPEPPPPDPKPEPPAFEDYDACCGSGCDPCLFDLYDQAMERYRTALQAWQERHPDTGSSS